MPELIMSARLTVVLSTARLSLQTFYRRQPARYSVSTLGCNTIAGMSFITARVFDQREFSREAYMYRDVSRETSEYTEVCAKDFELQRSLRRTMHACGLQGGQ